MSVFTPNQRKHGENLDSEWKSLYKAGGLAALLAVAAFVLDIAISFGGEDFSPAALDAVGWFRLYRENALAGLRGLGFINILSLSVSLPLYFALYATLRQGSKAGAALGLIVYLLGAAIYISNNAAVPMIVLSGKYAAAATDAQRMLIAAAGEAVLARGADFTPGSFSGFFFTEIAVLAFCLIMLRSRVFSRSAALAGIAGFALLTVFTIWSTFIPARFDLAMIVAIFGGLLSIAWYILVSRRLFQLGLGDCNTSAEPAVRVLRTH